MDANDLYRQSCDLVLPYIRLEGPSDRPAPDLSLATENLRKGIEGFKQVIAENPESWVAYWMLGKAHQALEEDEEAYQAFLAAHKIKVVEENVMRELALECLRTKRFDMAAYYCQGAQEFDPEDYTLWANMAVAKLFQHKLDAAEQWANRCLQKLPNDEPSMQVLRIVKEIRAGTRAMPTDFNELEKE